MTKGTKGLPAAWRDALKGTRRSTSPRARRAPRPVDVPEREGPRLSFAGNAGLRRLSLRRTVWGRRSRGLSSTASSP